MSNDWRKYVQTDEEFAKDNEEEQDPRKVLQEDFEFLAKNWHWYLIAIAMSLIAVGTFLAMFISLLGLLLGEY